MRFRFRLIPATLVAATLVGGVKLGQVCSGAAAFFGAPTAVAKTGKTAPTAQNGAPMPLIPAPATASATPPAAAPMGPPSGPPTAQPAAATDAAGPETPPDIHSQAQSQRHGAKAFDNPTQFSRADISLLQDLTKRRRELDQREQTIDMREKLLTAMSKRLDAKIAEMRTLRASLKAMLAQRQAEHSQRIKSLVEVYQNMNPKNAARIFSRLEMPILLEVVSKMSENKLAPILAAMDPAKVQIITTDLATEGTGAAGVATGGAQAGAPNNG